MVFKTIKPIKLILDQIGYIGDEKLNICQLRSKSPEKKTHTLKKK
jgi:hypothetical protein